MGYYIQRLQNEQIEFLEKEAGMLGDAYDSVKGGIRSLWRGYKNALTGGEEGEIIKHNIREVKRMLKQKELLEEAKNEYKLDLKEALKDNLKDLRRLHRPILAKQILTAGATAGGLGLAGYGAYRFYKNRNKNGNKSKHKSRKR